MVHNIRSARTTVHSFFPQSERTAFLDRASRRFNLPGHNRVSYRIFIFFFRMAYNKPIPRRSVHRFFSDNPAQPSCEHHRGNNSLYDSFENSITVTRHACPIHSFTTPTLYMQKSYRVLAIGFFVVTTSMPFTVPGPDAARNGQAARLLPQCRWLGPDRRNDLPPRRSESCTPAS